jgi:putative transposase
MPRQARLDAPGTLHHVIVRGIEKRRIVDDDEDRVRFVGRLAEIVQASGTRVYAWALMTNHLHLLLRSGPWGLPKFMRRMLTGYAITYNIRHARHGHLFQNRYRSVVCDEDAYFKELVRYIHLNPLKAKAVKDLGELERYRWCGHRVLLGRGVTPWQDREYVLSWFGGTEGEARSAYRRYVAEGAIQGKRPDLEGGGLLRSFGGWSAVLSLRRSREARASDQRILGTGEFVEKVLEEAEERAKRGLDWAELKRKMRERVEVECRQEGVSVEEMRNGSRRGSVSRIRADLAVSLVEELGGPLAEVAVELGVSTSAVSKILLRRKH